MSDNAKQHAYWNGPLAERWAENPAARDRALVNMTAALMAFAAPAPGMRVLDVGCGAGSTVLALAEAVAPGRVTGIDISAPLLAAARRQGAAFSNLDFLEADASSHPYVPEFDLVFSSLGTMFFADPVAAFAHLRSALKPDGRLAFSCWCHFEEIAAMHAPFEAAAGLVPPREVHDPYAPGPFALADIERTKSILARAGFRGIHAERFETVLLMGAAVEEAAAEALNMGPLGHAARELDDETRTQIRARVAMAMERFRTPAGITPPAVCWLVGARA